MALMFMLLCLHVLDSYVELKDDRWSDFAFFFAAWPELKTRFLTSPGNSCDRWVLSRVAFTVAEVCAPVWGSELTSKDAALQRGSSRKRC